MILKVVHAGEALCLRPHLARMLADRGIKTGIASPTTMGEPSTDQIPPIRSSLYGLPAHYAPSAAYFLTRICLGINILMHGLVRWPHLENFVAQMEKEFAGTFLGAGMVIIAAHLIVYGETIVGFLVLIGFCLPSALIAGFCLMILLQVGTTLVADWSTAGTQLIYVMLYAALLAAVNYDVFSIDAWRQNRHVDKAGTNE